MEYSIKTGNIEKMFDDLVKSRFIEMFDWCDKKPLTTFANITMGQSPESSTYNDDGIGLPFYQGKTDFGDTYVTERKYCSSPKKTAKSMDILMSVRAPVGSVNITEKECCIGRGLAAISPIQNKTDLFYLYTALKLSENKISDLGVGSTFTAINKTDMSKIMIPDAKFDDQIKFSNFVKQVDKSKLIYKQMVSKFDELVKSRFIEMFGTFMLGNQNDSWEPIDNIGEIVSGSTPKTNDDSFWDGTIKWMTPAEIGSEKYVKKTERMLTKEGFSSCSLTMMPKGTVILSSRAPIGKVAISAEEMCCNQGFKNIICGPRINNEFLYFILKNNTEYLNSLGRGATFKEISRSIVRSIKIPVPPIELQNEFANFVKQVDKSKDILESQIKEKLEIN